MAETCETCRFYLAPLSGRIWNGPYRCRRYPIYVERLRDDWCGEHQPKGGEHEA